MTAANSRTTGFERVSRPDTATALAGLPPVVDRRTRVIIFGSFPGTASLRHEQYYAHPCNQFWPLLSAVLGDDLFALPYPLRLGRLLEHRIGLWDVIAGCERVGSLDSAIRHARENDFRLLKASCPELARACFNGQAAGRRAAVFAQAGLDTLTLPSSSPAHRRMTFLQKLDAWRCIIHGIS